MSTSLHALAALTLPMFAGCADPDAGEAARPGLTLEATGQGAAVRATWTTAADGESWIEYGEDGAFDHRIDAAESTAGEHTLVLAGLAGGVTWSARVGTAAGEGEGVEITTPEPPSELFTAQLTVPPDDEVGGFYLGTTVSPDLSWAFVMDRLGRLTWWQKTNEPGITTQVRLSADGGWIEWLSDEPAPGIGRIRLDGSDAALVSIPNAHHEFLDLGDRWLVVVGEEREVEGRMLRGDTLQEIGRDGASLRTVWSAWDWLTPDPDSLIFTVPGSDTLDWTHTNSFHHDAETGGLLVSLYGIFSVAQVDYASGAMAWVLGSGPESDFRLTAGEAFSAAHTPVPTEDGFVIFENGPNNRLESRVLSYAVDEAAGTWAQVDSYSPEPHIFAAVLGNVEPQPDGGRFVNWGSAGRLELDGPDGTIRTQIDLPLGSAFGFVHAIPEIGGATW